jgi:hypothetical protein
MFETKEDLHRHVRDNYPEVTDQRINQSHWDLSCPRCKVVRGFQVTSRSLSREYDNRYQKFFVDSDAPITYYFRCPVCTAFKQWIVFELVWSDESEQNQKHYFRVTSLPSEGLEDIEELPNEPPSLRTAYRQAVRAMDANAHLAAAAMFRRALQVITRELLSAKPGNLVSELKQCVGKKYNGVTITADFAEIGYIIKEAGNQGAHPDSDPDLLDFTPQDAADLQRIFMELVSELFIAPLAMQKAKAEFLARRKISSPA